MKSLLLALLLLVAPSTPKYTVIPNFAPAPAVVTFLLTNIPEGSRTACFILSGDNEYAGCKEVDGRKSYRVEYRNVRAGEYAAGVTLDGQLVPPVQKVIITATGPE